MAGREKISFTCPKALRDKLTELANNQGVSRSQLIIELLEIGLESYSSSTGVYHPNNDKLLWVFQERLQALEKWQKEIEEWRKRIEPNIDNHEQVLMELLNREVETPNFPQKKKVKVKDIPKP